MTLHRLWLSCAMTGTLALLTAPAAAEITKSECVDANTNAQSLRRDGKLADARKLLQSCNDPACPRIVRTDCARRLDELEAAQPTVVFDAHAATGGDLSEVKVSVDGHLLTGKLDGTALAVNPGEHVFLFEVQGLPPVTEKLLLKEGDKARRVRVILGVVPTAPAPLTPVPAQPEAVAPSVSSAHTPDQPGGLGTRRIVGLTLAGVGVASVAVGGVLGVLASSAWSNSQSECGSSAACPNRAQAVSDHDSAVTSGLVSTIGFAAGGAMIAGGAILFFTGGKEAPKATAALSITPSIGPGRIAIEGRF